MVIYPFCETSCEAIEDMRLISLSLDLTQFTDATHGGKSFKISIVCDKT